MVETMLGIWLFILTALAGYVAGRYVRRGAQLKRQKEAGCTDDAVMRELANFLRYDGSGLPHTVQSGKGETY